MDKSFKNVQDILKNPLVINIPRKGDTCFLANDACAILPGMATKLFLKRPGVEGFLPSFNHGFRVKSSMLGWSPCELEAFSLSKGIEKFSHFLKITENPSVALVDSKATYQAKLRLDQGKFSTSKRLQDLLANMSALRMSIQLMSAKQPSPLLQMVDFNSRHPVECDLELCTICKDLQQPDITFFGGTFSPDNIPFASKSVWQEIQKTCPDLRLTCILLRSGKEPTKKEKNIKDVRTYLRKCSLTKDGLLVVKRAVPFQAEPAELIVVPRDYGYTLGKALHHHLDHPNPTQMRRQFSRKYFMLDEEKTLKEDYNHCSYPCQALRRLPLEVMEYHTDTKPNTVGSHFNCDIMEESKQKIMVLRENLSSFTATGFVDNQQAPTLKNALIVLALQLRLAKSIVIRVDAHSSFKALANDKQLSALGINLVIGHSKNPNKNSVAEKAIRELRDQLLRISPQGGPFSEVTLARATDNLNSMIRHAGISAKEL